MYFIPVKELVRCTFSIIFVITLTVMEGKLNSNVCGTIRRCLKNNTRKDTQLKFYKIAVAVLTCGAGTWSLVERSKRKLGTGEMWFVRWQPLFSSTKCSYPTVLHLTLLLLQSAPSDSAHPLPALHEAAKNDETIHIHPEDGNCSVCGNG
jgi:predicted metal-binding protein